MARSRADGTNFRASWHDPVLQFVQPVHATEARKQSDIVKQVNSFLTDDLLGRGNPANSGKANETLMEAAEEAEPRIADRFSKEPAVAASVYAALALAFSGRSAYDAARVPMITRRRTMTGRKGSVLPMPLYFVFGKRSRRRLVHKVARFLALKSSLRMRNAMWISSAHDLQKELSGSKTPKVRWD